MDSLLDTGYDFFHVKPCIIQTRIQNQSAWCPAPDFENTDAHPVQEQKRTRQVYFVVIVENYVFEIVDPD